MEAPGGPWFKNRLSFPGSEELIEFTGAANWHCFGERYVVFCCGGVKAEGEIAYNSQACEDEAWAALTNVLTKHLVGAEQVALRKPPEVVQMKDGSWNILVRLARFPSLGAA